MTDFDDPIQLEDYKRKMFALFREEGWSLLMSETVAWEKEIGRLEAVGNTDDLLKKQGQLSIIARLRNWPYEVERMEIDSDEETV